MNLFLLIVLYTIYQKYIKGTVTMLLNQKKTDLHIINK